MTRNCPAATDHGGEDDRDHCKAVTCEAAACFGTFHCYDNAAARKERGRRFKNSIGVFVEKNPDKYEKNLSL